MRKRTKEGRQPSEGEEKGGKDNRERENGERRKGVRKNKGETEIKEKDNEGNK